MAKAVTDISGRGVGMDAVKTKVEALGGQLDLVSRLGQGTRVYVRLPLTLAIVLSLLIKVGNETYAISLENVEETILVKKENIKTVHGAPATLLRGEVLSLSDLGKVLETEMDDTDRDEYPDKTVRPSDGRTSWHHVRQAGRGARLHPGSPGIQIGRAHV